MFRSLPSRASTYSRLLSPRPFSTSTTSNLSIPSSASALSPSSPSSSLAPQITTLENGLRVATESTPGHFFSAGVYLEAGSRFEDERWRGVSHMVDRLAFKSTRDHTLDSMNLQISSLGSQFLSSSSRESILYQSVSYPSSKTLALTLSLLSQTIIHPTFHLHPEELESQKPAMMYELKEIKNRPEMWIPELLHEVAWKGNTLGNELLCPEDRVESMTVERVKEYMDTWFRPERAVIAGVGVGHEEMVELVEKYFADSEWGVRKSFGGPGDVLGNSTTNSIGNNSPRQQQVSNHLLNNSSTSPSQGSQPGLFKSLSTFSSSLASVSSSMFPDSPTPPPSSTSSPQPNLTPYQLSQLPSKYSGGELYLDRPGQDFNHLYVGFEGLGIHDPDIYALATLQVLLGGGGSFSAGGPGKGMYSRLYTNVLNRYHAVDFCSSFHHCYNDSGLFGMSISVNPAFTSRASEVIAQQLDSICEPRKGDNGIFRGNGISLTEFERAKNQLKSSLVMALESRMVQCEDLGRQVQVHGKKIPAAEMCAKIDAISLDDVTRVANRVLRPSRSGKEEDRGRGEPTIVGMGMLQNLGDVKGVLRRYGFGAGA